VSAETKGFPYLKDVAKGAGIGLGVLALIIGGFSIGGFGAPAPTSSNNAQQTTAASATPSATPTDARTCSVSTDATDPRLGNFQAVVIDSATDTVLFDRGADTAAATASTMKLLTAGAALNILGPNYRVDTRVYQDPAQPSTVILVGGGDPTLSRTAPGQQSVYRDAPKLATLAVGVNAKMAGTPITKIIVDSTLFNGPSWETTWERTEQTQGYMSEVTALQADGDRQNPSANTSPRSTTPVLNAGKYFKKALGAIAAGATISEGKAPGTALEIAKVSSQPISVWIKHMLQVSDNTEAEALARLVSLDLGYDGSFSSLNIAIKKGLANTQLDSAGLVIKDGSGLSDLNAVPPSYLAKFSKLVLNGFADFSVIKDGLPVSGESGSLSARFTGELKDAVGQVHAKTGWIKHGYTLAGYITARDKSTLLFAIYALGPNVKDNAKDAIDKLATDFFRCGTQLSNN
jgi:D-alanyl-D-alanine carboxypeptidase/D-alanyl-D-alanine-endopeptidase (penicillin-binding protein 4)